MWHLRTGANYMLCLSISWMEFHADQMLSIGILPVACTWCTDSIWLVDVFRQGHFYISNMWNLGRIWLFKQLQQLPMSWQVKRIPMKTHFHHIPSSRFLGFPDHIWGGSGQKVRRRYLICWHVNVLKLGVLSNVWSSGQVQPCKVELQQLLVSLEYGYHLTKTIFSSNLTNLSGQLPVGFRSWHWVLWAYIRV